jgi:hypothetical protein
MDIIRDPHEAWQKVKDISGALKFLGGKRCGPLKNTDTKCYTLSRAPVGPGPLKPRHPAGHLEMDKGIVIGAQQTPAVANALQQQVTSIVEERFPLDDRLSLKTYGVLYHNKMAYGARHAWMAHALNEEVQELVSQALGGAKLSLVEASVFKAADELQRHQKGMVAFKEAMGIALESESDSKSRRGGGRLLFSKKKEEINRKADLKLMAARGLKDWEKADDDLREARKQAHTEAKK